MVGQSDSEKRKQGSKTTVIAALIGNLLICVSKFAAAAITGSSALLAEALHSSADTGNEALLLLGMHKAKKPPDGQHPFGHGKELYFWSLIVAVLLFAVGGGASIYEGVLGLMGQREPLAKPAVSYTVLGVALLFESASLSVGLRELARRRGERGFFQTMHQEKDPTFVLAVVEDSVAIVGILIAALGLGLSYGTGARVYDAAASLAIGVLLCAAASWLARESKSLILGESADPELVRRLEAIATADPAVQRCGRVLTMHLGPEEILVNVDLKLAPHLDSAELVQAVGRIEAEMRRQVPQVRDIFLEARSLATEANIERRRAP